MSALSSITFGSATPLAIPPIAKVGAQPAYGVIGSVVKINGQESENPSARSPKSGNDGTTNNDTLSSPTGGFNELDVNRVITLGGGVDVGKFKIVSVLSATQVQVVDAVTGGTPTFNGGATSWSIVDSLSFSWSFVSTPIGSKVVQEGFRELEDDNSLVSFSPDVVGEYVIGLVVSNGSYSSALATTQVSVRAILVPHGRGLVPDGKWIWSYIRDVWNEVDGKEWFETFWSALIQIAGAELLKLYQVDFNKSIRDIQDLYQRRWLPYEPRLELAEADLSFIIGDQCVGQDATTINLGSNGLAVILSSSELIVVTGSPSPQAPGQVLTIIYDEKDAANVGDYRIFGINASKNGYKLESAGPDPGPDKIDTGVHFAFDLGSTTWHLSTTGALDYAETFSGSGSPIDELTPILFPSEGTAASLQMRAGDYVHVPKGVNAGFYRITSLSGSFITVDRAPPGSSDGTTPMDIYRPVAFKVSLPDQVISDSFAVTFSSGANDVSQLAQGRVITCGGQCFTILRSTVDFSRSTPLTIITTDGGTVLTGLVRQNWRAPHTLISASQNFEDLGISPGDLLLIDVLKNDSKTAVTVKAQVIGVDRFRLGFVLTDDVIEPGVIPPIPDQTFIDLTNTFNVASLSRNPDGTLAFNGLAARLLAAMQSGAFANQYFNKVLTTSSEIDVLGQAFTLRPRFVIRNHAIPVDENLRSIPMLQDWIVQPTWVQHNGKTFQVKNGKEFEIRGPPLTLIENSDFIIDDENAVFDTLGFKTGTDIIEVEDAHFLDRGIRPGDSFIIHAPVSLAGTYYVGAVLSQTELLLTRPVPRYVLGENVIAQVEVKRKRTGHFLRFVPGGFTAKNPAPSRIWGEVSFFDNSDAVESNFGILVGLNKADLENISKTINYRQAVAGLMYAYTQGSALDKVRLGGQILLGLPFAEHPGIIRSIENDYRLDIQGNPIEGRILIEDTAADGTPEGTLRVYTFPIDQESDLAGVETNPATGKTYAVGDSVILFAALSKGVEVSDYLTSPLNPNFSAAAKLRQFHTVRMKANDNIFSLSELTLVSDFLRKITPSYVQFIITSSAEFKDDVLIEDKLTMRLAGTVFDNESMSIPTALKWDSTSTLRGIPTVFWESPYYLRKSGRHLVTGYNAITPSVQATDSGGGILNPQAGEGPVSRIGDVLYILTGPNQGKYPITDVPDDITVDVSGLPTSGFQSGDQSYAILRPLDTLLRTGSFSCNNASLVQTLSAGLTADMVAPGDWLFVSNGSVAKKYIIAAVGPLSSPSLAAGQVQLTTIPTHSGNCTYWIFRPAFFTSPYVPFIGNLVSNGSVYTSLNVLTKGILEPGDELIIQDGTQTHLTVPDPVNLKIFPVLPAGTYSVAPAKKGHFGTAIVFDHLQTWNPQDSADISLVDTVADATATAASPNVAIGATILVDAPLPGDLFIFTSGQNATVDVGYGPGVCPVLSGSTPTLVVLSMPATYSETNTFKILRRR